MSSNAARYYDDIYAANGKDYRAEADIVHKFIQLYKQSKGNTLLDVGCGTGIHVNLLSRKYRVEGLDLDKGMIAVARRNFPQIRFRHGDMVDFKLTRKFDAIVCLFSAIGYVKTKSRLQGAIKTMSRHLLPGGVLLVEPWFTPEEWHPGRVYVTQVDKDDAKIVRMSHSSRQGKVSIIEFQYLFGTSKGIKRETEILELGLFTKQDYLDAFRSAGLNVIRDDKGLDGRGLYIGQKSLGAK
ncbi:MAG: class I SAM-dependent methyltransferase [Chloroflexi bacterium]|nr:class I SAM-dependent methyltransferase [Chloroflexota bacterium]